VSRRERGGVDAGGTAPSNRSPMPTWVVADQIDGLLIARANVVRGEAAAAGLQKPIPTDAPIARPSKLIVGDVARAVVAGAAPPGPPL